MTPDWLPPKIELNGNKASDDYSILYEIYKRDFICSNNIIIDGDSVVVDHSPDPATDNLYTHGFTHLVTVGAGNRSIDYERASKLPWVRAVLENYTAPEVTGFWVSQPKGETLYLWLTECDFVVILRRLKSKKEQECSKKIIVTAYHVQPYGRKELQRLYGRSTKQL